MEKVLGAESEEQLTANLDLPMDQRETRTLVMKRKVLRHGPNGRVEVFDESRNAKPQSLGHYSAVEDGTISQGEIDTSSSTLEHYLNYDSDDLGDDPYSLIGDFGSDTISEYPIPGRAPTNYIAPQAARAKRTDPVAKLNGYKQDWERFSVPGQDAHQSLRWAVRRQMLQPGLPRQVQKRLVPNTYEVPTMKKRDSLRFGVRWDLAHRLMPRRNSSS
ncbi:centriolar and ciliogenesis-associated protein HYLS1 [Hirundo rustica]|uniref:centriolar and ciliogenesis-associated protein HYLS1 n=1 Tax=Hirundo rustica TaxID=43150 RepID=UPI002672C9EE|nr:centriolar and ciliogenesis-associated protein HYLS1 [Hirundo rustica]